MASSSMETVPVVTDSVRAVLSQATQVDTEHQEASAYDQDDAASTALDEEIGPTDDEDVSFDYSPKAVIAATMKATTSTSKAITLPVELWERILIYLDPDYMHKVSQISQQHLAITKSTMFRARYFYARHMPCQAMYYATCRSKLFTKEVMQGLLSLGAVISRYFCQSISQQHHNPLKQRNSVKWSSRLSTNSLLALLNEGDRLYGDTLKLTASDGIDIKLWTDNLVRLPALTDSIREKFVKGRFAVFNNDDTCLQPPYTPKTPMAMAIAQHSELLQILVKNGYEFDQAEQEGIVVCIAQKYADDEEGLYQRWNDLLIQFPDWIIESQSRHLSEYVTAPSTKHYDPVPATEMGRDLLANHDGIGPIKVGLKVMKRLYDKGCAFGDLDKTVKTYLNVCFKNYSSSRMNSAANLRILAHLFPKSVEEYKVQIATTFVCQFENSFSESTPTERSYGMNMLFKLLDELEMTKKEWRSLVLNDFVGLDKFFQAAVKRGYFGTIDDMNEDDKEALIGELVSGCISGPMSGNHIYNIEAVAKDLLFANEKSMSKRQKKAIATVTEAIQEALLKWQFNLDTLKPDINNAVCHKLRTPIAWITKGQYTMTSYDHISTYTTNPDPHQLLPYGQRPGRYQGSELSTLTFAYPQPNLVHLGEIDLELKSVEVPKPQSEEKAGWQHLGHIDQLEAMTNDSGVMIVEKIPEVKGVEKEQIRKTPTTGKFGSLASFSMKVVRIQCAACSRCGGPDHYCTSYSMHHCEAKEMIAVLPFFLPADSPALRDVVLAHALVNGNVAVVQQLMSGTYEEEESSDKEAGEVKPKLANKLRVGQPNKPVLPTLAHWRILQAIERKPLERFVDRILEGAPFKRGYVQSNETIRIKEEDSHERREWYRKKGHKDDRPMKSLFIEKQRLEALDKASKKKKRGSRRNSKAKSKSRDDDEEMVPFRAASQIAEASKETTSARVHLRRSATRKPVRYNESASLSSEEDEDSGADKVQREDYDEFQVSKMHGTSSRFRKKADQMSDGDLFGHGSDLSEMSSDGEEQAPRRSISGKADSDTDSDDDEEAKASEMYNFKADDTPMVTMKTEDNDLEIHVPLQTLYRRSKSLKLWLEHLCLLRWFEQRKEVVAKEKAQKARQRGRRSERISRSKFSIGLSECIRRMELEETRIQKSLEPALKARRSAVIQSKKRKVNELAIKWEATKEGVVGKVNKTRGKTSEASAARKRKLIELAHGLNGASSSRKKRLSAIKK